jgi:hypothetical protein
MAAGQPPPGFTLVPQGFTAWPPASPQDLIDALNQAWDNRPGKGDPAKTHGPFWALQVWGYNPISGYRVEFTNV